MVTTEIDIQHPAITKTAASAASANCLDKMKIKLEVDRAKDLKKLANFVTRGIIPKDLGDAWSTFKEQLWSSRTTYLELKKAAVPAIMRALEITIEVAQKAIRDYKKEGILLFEKEEGIPPEALGGTRKAVHHEFVLKVQGLEHFAVLYTPDPTKILCGNHFPSNIDDLLTWVDYSLSEVDGMLLRVVKELAQWHEEARAGKSSLGYI